MNKNLWQKLLLSPFAYRLVLAGICAILAYCLLAWNEHQVIEFVQETGHVPKVIEYRGGKIDPSLDGKLIHYVAPVNVLTDIVDPEFAIRTKAIKLIRHVTMLQWQEMKLTSEEKALSANDANAQEYGYQKVWSLNLIDSHRFRPANREQYANPVIMPYLSRSYVSPKASMGSYRLSEALLQHLEEGRILDLNAFDLSQYVGSEENSIHHDGSNIYLGADPEQPRIGDQRIEFSVILPQVVSILASPKHGVLQPYQHDSSKPIAVIRVGQWTAEELFPKLHQVSPWIGWSSRLSALFLLSLSGWILLQWYSKRQALLTSLWVGIATECLLFSSLWYRQNVWLALLVLMCAMGMMMACIRLQAHNQEYYS